MARVVEDSVFYERSARRKGFLQGLDARVKLISVLSLAVGATFLHCVSALWALGLFAFLAMVFSGLGVRRVLSRTWWVAPGLFMLVTLPAVLSVFTPGDSLVILYRTPRPVAIGPVTLPGQVSITGQGVAVAALLVSRIAVGVMLALMLALTTRWQELLRAAYTGATAPFVLVATMMYRYVFVLLRIAEEMHLGKRARTICPGTAAQERRWIGHRVGALFVRSRHLSEQVYAAMLARGYRGEAKAMIRSRVGRREVAWSAMCGLALGLALAVNHAAMRGLPW
jgi:cobalt/nickel transport system permease protein